MLKRDKQHRWRADDGDQPVSFFLSFFFHTLALSFDTIRSNKHTERQERSRKFQVSVDLKCLVTVVKEFLFSLAFFFIAN